jgi:hypothetical protein
VRTSVAELGIPPTNGHETRWRAWGEKARSEACAGESESGWALHMPALQMRTIRS